MGKFLIALFGFIGTSAVAANDGFFYMRPGMIKADQQIHLARSLHGELACDLYKMRLEKGALRESQLMARQKIGVTQVGTYISGVVKFPEPYSNYQVMFDHAMVAYAEANEPMLPYLQAFFLVNGIPDTTHVGASTDMRFDISGIEPNSKLILRGSLSATPDALLTFNCSMRFE